MPQCAWGTGRANSLQVASAKAYGETVVLERHRHRYEFNNDYREQLEKAGLRISGSTEDGRLVEIVEVVDHPWFVGVQFHPEFTSRPLRPAAAFREFIAAAKNAKRPGEPDGPGIEVEPR